MNRKLTLIIFLVLLGILTIGTIPYFITFNSFTFSKKPEDWSAFGDYTTGIISIINLFIFIYITFYISRLDQGRSNSEKALQKKIILAQFRQSELGQIDKKLDDAVDFNGIEEKANVLQRISSTILVLTNFINQKVYLFPTLADESNHKQALNLLEKLSQFHDIVFDTYGENVEDSTEKIFETKLQAYIFMKNEFIENLQLFILTDLD